MNKYNIEFTSTTCIKHKFYVYYIYNNLHYKQELYVKTESQANKRVELLHKCFSEGIYPYNLISKEWDGIIKSIKEI